MDKAAGSASETSSHGIFLSLLLGHNWPVVGTRPRGVLAACTYFSLGHGGPCKVADEVGKVSRNLGLAGLVTVRQRHGADSGEGGFAESLLV